MSKRSARDLALEYVAEEILEAVRARDENGVPLHQEIMTDPVTFVLFNTPEAFLDVLKNKPVRLLNLIRTNKALNKVWLNIPGIWPVLLDNLLALEEADDDEGHEYSAKAKSGHMSKIYPFFMVAQHRVEELAAPIFNLRDPNRVVGKANPLIVEGYHALLPKFRLPVQVLGKTYSGARYSLIYYDVVTQLFMALLQTLSVFNQAWALGRPISYPLTIAEYLGITLDEAHMRYELKLPDYVVVLHDCFLVSENTEIVYHPSVIRIALKKIIAWLDAFTFSVIVPNVRHFMTINLTQVNAPTPVIEAIAGAKADALRLQKLIASESLVESKQHTRLYLDEDVARPYRDILFNRVNGLYNTPELQQSLFVDVLSALYLNRYADDDNPGGRDEFIRRYGCSVCGKETEHVDPVLLKAFCVDGCHHS